MSTSTSWTSPTTATASRKPTDHYSSSTIGGSTASSSTPITETHRATQDPTVASSSVRTTTMSSPEGVATSAPSHRTRPTANSSSAASPPSFKTTEATPESSSGGDRAETTSTTKISRFTTTAAAVGKSTSSVGTTETAAASSNHASNHVSCSSTQDTASSSTVLPDFVSLVTTASSEEATVSESDREPRNSNAPSASTLTPVGSTGRSYRSTNPEDEGTSKAAMEQERENAKVSGSRRSTPTSTATERTAGSVSYDFTRATRILASSTPLNDRDSWSTTAAEENGNDPSTNAMATFTAKNTGHEPGSTPRESTDCASSTHDGQDPTSSRSVNLSTLEGSTVPTAAVKNVGSYSTTEQSGDGTTITNDAGSTDGSTSLTPPTSPSNESPSPPTSPSNESPSPFPRQTEPILSDEKSGTTKPTITEKWHGEQNPTTQTRTDSNNLQSSTLSSDAEKHATTNGGGNVSTGDSGFGSSLSSATTSPPDGSVDRTTGKTNTETDGSVMDSTTTSLDGSEHTTTSYAGYLKNIKLNLSADFTLSSLTAEQKANLKDLSNAYGLDVGLILAH